MSLAVSYLARQHDQRRRSLSAKDARNIFALCMLSRRCPFSCTETKFSSRIQLCKPPRHMQCYALQVSQPCSNSNSYPAQPQSVSFSPTNPALDVSFKKRVSQMCLLSPLIETSRGRDEEDPQSTGLVQGPLQPALCFLPATIQRAFYGGIDARYGRQRPRNEIYLIIRQITLRMRLLERLNFRKATG